MFVIVDKQAKFPYYFWKVDGENLPVISVDIKQAKQFLTFKDARAQLESLGILMFEGEPVNLFNFEVVPLTIKI